MSFAIALPQHTFVSLRFFPFSVNFVNDLIVKGNRNQKLCIDEDRIECPDKIPSLVGESSETFKKCDCLPDCNEIVYTYVRVDSRITSETSAEYVEVNGTVPLEAFVSIYFGSDEYSGFKRYATYGTVSILSDIGGFLGLFLGVSALSVIETIYFFTLRFFNDFRS